jgi:hypothetical protein
MTETKTMEMNLSNAEMAVVEQLAEAKGLTRTGVLRQALRLYQVIDRHASEGRRVMLVDADKTPVEILMRGFAG